MRRIVLLSASAFALVAPAATPTLAETAPEITAEAPQSGITMLFEEYDAARLELSPTSKAYRGIRDEDYGKWDEVSDAADEREFRLLQDAAATMRASYDLGDLPEQDALSFRLFELTAERSASLYPFRKNGFLFDHRRGAHTSMPAFLINIHGVGSDEDALAYVERMAGIGPQLDALIAESRARVDAGVMPPDWVYPYVIADLENLIVAGDGNAILLDLAAKVEKLDLDESVKLGINGGAKDVWWDSAVPAY
ncbi:MAG: DUF885 family protein, partial [Pseudomonadota bacterium]